MIEKTLKMISLFDFYSELLTEKQIEYFTYYYEKDLSLMEIANNFKVSRNAIYDNLKRVENSLLEYEHQLKLYQKYLKRKKIIDEIKEKSNGDLTILIDKLEKI